MPMFYTPKPRQFHYKPRFYDPEKERWEALKQKYADEHRDDRTEGTAAADEADKDLEYFERRVREMDREERQRGSRLTWKDMFRKREMPEFRYTPRFSSPDGETTGNHGESDAATARHTQTEGRHKGKKIQRRFALNDDQGDKEPIPATRILLYTALVCLLLYWVLF